ncbi:flagellar motor protein MotB [Palleronia sp. LCG004]|uniref:flagellar motor protein MotB n=1 Tax=Palleronia sp. LCG004 TaxID=3079304 RepID=UPI00294215C6|nr:flagellar motor protein MotB [Palleronia sp. LCG004]WOI56327.1 flagellar motor protein MotB [Palleronia sp. LCG004]
MASNRPIIIKRKKVVGGGGHHGGAWKVAYADFVTAMMAFFMLMWLLNATTDTQRKGIADYFSPEIPLMRVSGGGAGALGGADPASNDQYLGEAGGEAQNPTQTLSYAEDAQTVTDELMRYQELLTARAGESTVSDDLLKHIVTRVTDEGLIVDLFDLPGARLFEVGTAEPTGLMTDLLLVVRDVFSLATNEVAINGHVRSEAIVRMLRDEWELSAARAQKVREMLTAGGFDAGRIRRIGGFADREHVRPDPMDIRNNRIELILLR